MSSVRAHIIQQLAFHMLTTHSTSRKGGKRDNAYHGSNMAAKTALYHMLMLLDELNLFPMEAYWGKYV